MNTSDPTQLHRTAKYFMDSGRAATLDEAMRILESFSLSVLAGPEVAESASHQLALLTFVNAARRTFLGGVDVTGVVDTPLRVPLVEAGTLAEGVRKLGGRLSNSAPAYAPQIVIGSATPPLEAPCAWRITWAGWRGGVVPAIGGPRLGEDSMNALAPAMAAAVCAADAFAWYAGDHPMAGKRPAGLSLWRPDTCWLDADSSEPELAYLPSRLWLIGLGNLGQAYAWLLACLPYKDRSAVELVLQDFDKIAVSNDSTSMLSSRALIGMHKTRAVGGWLERLGFTTTWEERRFGEWTRRIQQEPGVALCGVDNALARADLDKAGFDLIVESGLGAGPDGFRNFSMHTFPSSRKPEQVWPRHATGTAPNVSSQPAYKALRASGLDECGLTQLASRTVGVPFVGLIAGSLVVSELLRRLHGAEALELASGSVADLEDIAIARMGVIPYSGAYASVRVATSSRAVLQNESIHAYPVKTHGRYLSC